MKIALINPYFGKWPIWFPMYLISCQHNPSIDWIIPTDCEIPPVKLPNVHFINDSLTSLCKRVSEYLNLNISYKRPYKLCDLRPLFPHLYKEQLEGYEFWGHCDLDIIWGDIKNFIDDDILKNNDVISSRKDRISGHFSLFRNIDPINNAYKFHPMWKDAVTKQNSYYFDEVGMTEVYKNYWNHDFKPRIYWPEFLFNYKSVQGENPAKIPYSLRKWFWENGKVFETESPDTINEVMYFNFMHWKKTIKHCFINYNDKPDKVYLGFSHFSEKKPVFPSQLGPVDFSKFFRKLYI